MVGRGRRKDEKFVKIIVKPESEVGGTVLPSSQLHAHRLFWGFSNQTIYVSKNVYMVSGIEHLPSACSLECE